MVRPVAGIMLIEKWQLRLPMASAILTVLYPEDFTVYDVRVCNTLGGFHSIADRMAFESMWQEYIAFLGNGDV